MVTGLKGTTKKTKDTKGRRREEGKKEEKGRREERREKRGKDEYMYRLSGQDIGNTQIGRG
jgi:hypothetical protein